MGLYAVFRLSAKARIQVFGVGEVWGVDSKVSSYGQHGPFHGTERGS